jgi:hypothetical protein
MKQALAKMSAIHTTPCTCSSNCQAVLKQAILPADNWAIPKFTRSQQPPDTYAANQMLQEFGEQVREVTAWRTSLKVKQVKQNFGHQAVMVQYGIPQLRPPAKPSGLKVVTSPPVGVDHGLE